MTRYFCQDQKWSQRALCAFHKATKDVEMKSSVNYNVRAYKGQVPFRSKIVIYNVCWDK
jgi:hypothetical protein